jgi:signal transduction histidine kinase
MSTSARLLPASDFNSAASAEQIRGLRESGQIAAAIALCQDAAARSPDKPFFTRILGDLYFAAGDYASAFVSLADYLAIAPPSQRRHFATRYSRFRRLLGVEAMSRYSTMLDAALVEAKMDPRVVSWARGLLRQDLPLRSLPATTDPSATEFLSLLHDDANFYRLARLEKQIEAENPAILAQILDEVILNRERQLTTFRIDLFCSSIYERWERYDAALKIVSELLIVKTDHVATRALFRFCRLLENYDAADELLTRDTNLIKTDEFNVLYELIYYFEFKDDFRQVQNLLRKIEKRFGQNLSVLRTVRNFYVRFGLLDDAKRMDAAILELSRSRGGKTDSGRFIETLAESEAGVTSKIQQLYSELEHQRQLAAISDLTTGISHELGQPITNIRYTIQFHRRQFEKGVSRDKVLGVFDSILEETARMGGLISRLSPLTSSRSVTETFNVVDRIRARVQAEKVRLDENRIHVRIVAAPSILLTSDPVKFDQLLSNLLLNSIDAIAERRNPSANEIRIEVHEAEDQIQLSFMDTGVGIPFKNRNTIFDPFFSTKPPGKGEGLGLFIVWNVLKMQGGTIAVDTSYKNGAKFDIAMPKRPINQLENANEQ